ncbi:hypothetical protein EMIHUDRAFT_451478 [Emiliania huxleyi CCMP1516]|uniref:Uncharacterized protein n=2 Tax=Emiliania huxleyi TaxID=2903 RepID=A0A0D3J003_EMIH1|nr:hypothetical protein EMIHUDRAFT_451478 [Emiliania huxleyi CCMP1516]EOD16838.1 hypothetical protein EMIHUDRAFT_451478 [Emiliania huxleyi CCMP1516]|eukprot:XP_005769267.1 hypothetical protein EMIHUDRAFT_451478 [Emiliania huxleyi CCMP1516]
MSARDLTESLRRLQWAPAALARRVTAADSICSVVPAGAELRDVELPFNAGGKRRAEPSATSRRAHGRSKGRLNAGGKRRAEPSATSRRAHGRSKGRPALAGRGAPSHRRRPGELMGPQKVAPARGSAVGSAASGDGEAAGARLYRLVWSSQCGCVLY